MACSQTLAGIVKDCSPSMGGILEAYAISYDDVKTVSAEDGIIKTISLETSAKFKKYAFRKETSYFTSTRNIDHTTGNNSVSTEIYLLFPRMETTKRIEMEALSLAGLCLICKDANGKYWFFGKDDEVLASAGDAKSGTARGDRNGYSVTLTDNSLEYPYEVDASIVSGLVG